MIYSTLAILALSASATINPLTNLVHFHPRAAQPDTRVNVTLINDSLSFRDLKIDGKTYTVEAHHTLQVKAPAGTTVYAASRTANYHRGDAVLQVAPEMNQHRIVLN